MKTSPLEKIGNIIFRSMGETSSNLGDSSHILTSEEKSSLRAIERSAIIKSAIAGALSALISAISAIYAEKLYKSGPTETHQTLNYWLLFGGITLIAAALEIAYLYYITLRATHQTASICDIKIHKDPKMNSPITAHLVRAAMELPSPPDADPYVKPHRGYPKWRIIIISLLYKTKIMASNAILKITVRKIFLRGAARAWLELIAIPITAFWNSIVTYWILREARIRALGPSTINQILPSLLTDPTIHEPAQRAIACAIHASRDLHPNLAQMLATTRDLTEKTITESPENINTFHKSLSPLTKPQKQTILKILTLATIIDGKISNKENQLLNLTAEKTNLTPYDSKKLRLTFLNSDEPIKFKNN